MSTFCQTLWGKLPERVRQILMRARILWNRLQEKRLENQQRNRKGNLVLALLFPLMIVCLAELNQAVKPLDFLTFCVNRPTVLLFDFLVAYLLYGLLVMLSNRVWLAALVQGMGYMVVSVVELFKYSTNGNHFKLTDLTLATNVKNLTSFAYIKITLPLVVYLGLAFWLIGFIYYRNPAFTRPWRKRILPACCCCITCFAIVCVPGISQTVYGVFDVDTTEAQNAFSTNEKFNKNSMLAFLVQTASEKLENQLREPEQYDAATTEKLLTATPVAGNGNRPNVLVVMSESFADFRRLEGLTVDDSAYAPFDAFQARCHVLNAATPTFASYTVRTEFELMYGLPVRSLQDSITPQKEIEVSQPSSMVSYYHDLGYQTAYVHPFVSTFYGRDTIYADYGFDQMLFEDDLTVPVQEFGNGYISDETVVDQLLALVKESDAPIYIHATTMQNHQPYTWIENETELAVYLEGVRNTGLAMQRLADELTALDEPTVLLFVGDHFPSMRAEGNIYDALGINSRNCKMLYEQPALIWSNFPLQTDALPEGMISVCYLTPLLLRLSGLPVDAFYGTVLEQMEKMPVYTTIFMDDDTRNEVLDTLTYDRIVGVDYTGTREKIQEETGFFD